LGWLNIIESIRNYIKDYSIDHIDRGKNKVANSLSKKGLASQFEVWIMNIIVGDKIHHIQEFTMPGT